MTVRNRGVAIRVDQQRPLDDAEFLRYSLLERVRNRKTAFAEQFRSKLDVGNGRGVSFALALLGSTRPTRQPLGGLGCRQSASAERASLGQSSLDQAHDGNTERRPANAWCACSCRSTATASAIGNAAAA